MTALRNGEGLEVASGAGINQYIPITYTSQNGGGLEVFMETGINQKIPVEYTPEAVPNQEAPGTESRPKKVLWILVGVGILLAIIVAVAVAVPLTKKTNTKSAATTTATATATLTNTTASSNAIFDGSALAAIAFGNSVQFFYQNKSGNIFYETQVGEKVVGDPVAVPALAGAKVGTPLASISWSDGQQIRLYYLNNLNELQEHSYSNGLWVQGNLSTMGIRALETSQLAAISHGDNEVRLYFQVTNGAIQEYTWGNGTWVISQSLPVGIAGTGLAAIYYPPTDIRVYYQRSDPDLAIHEIGYGDYTNKTWTDKPGWYSGVATRGSRLAAVAWAGPKGPNGAMNIRLFYHPPESNSITLYFYSDSAGWVTPATVVNNISVVNGAMSVVNPAVSQFRLIYQDTKNSTTDLWTVE